MSERMIFPVETVLALCSAKEDVDTTAIASFILGRTIKCKKLASAAGLFAAAWLARLNPKFMDYIWDGQEAWESLVNRAANGLGSDKVSVLPMESALQKAAYAVLDLVADKNSQITALQTEVASLTGQVEALKPFEGQLTAAKKRVDQLEGQLKDQKKEMGGLRRQVAEFQGKMAVDQEELLEAIKDAIKDNLKNITVAAGAGAVAGAAAAAAGDAVAAEGGADEFGFSENAAPSGDEFGFSEGGSGDGFGFGF